MTSLVCEGQGESSSRIFCVGVSPWRRWHLGRAPKPGVGFDPVVGEGSSRHPGSGSCVSAGHRWESGVCPSLEPLPAWCLVACR